MRKHRKAHLGAVLFALAIFAGSCQPGEERDPKKRDESKPALTVGVSSAFAENQIVAEMYAQVLEKAGYKISRKLTLDSREISQPALESKQIDIKPEYLGSLLLHLDKNAQASSDPGKNAEQINKLLENKNAVLLEPSGADDTNALVVTKKTAQDNNLEKTSDLAAVGNRLILGGPPECPTRPFCIPGFEKTYGIKFKEFRALDVGGPLTVAALEGGEIDVALLFTTSGVIKKKGLVSLEDDKGLQTAENITPVVNAEAINEEIRRLLNSVSKVLTTENVTELNAKVEIDKEDPDIVAQEFLKSKNLI